MCRMEGFIVGINMREEWKAGNEGRASTDAGVVREVPTSTFRLRSAPRR